MGRFIVATGVNPDASHIDIHMVDPIVPVSGAVMLTEVAHPVSAWPDGTPSSGALLPNLVLDQAQAQFPLLTADQLKPSLLLGSTWPGKGLVERTSKGGLHLARNTVVGDANTIARLQVPTELITTNGMQSVLSHSFFASLWGRVTKAYAADWSSGGAMHTAFGSNGSAYFGFYSRRTTGETNYPTDTRRVGWRQSGAINTATTVGPLLQNTAVANLVAPTTRNIIIHAGNDLIPTADYGKNTSLVFYRFYLEDLTVSGRTYAEVDAIDNAMFTDEVLTSGGRYYGDTFTDPNTI